MVKGVGTEMGEELGVYCNAGSVNFSGFYILFYILPCTH